MYTTTTYNYSDADVAAGVIAAGIFIFVYILFVVAIYVINSLLLAQIFKKAKVAQWIAWVPFYNQWKFLELGGQQGFWAVLMIVPVVNVVSVVFHYIASYYIGLKLNKSGAFVLLAIFLPVVWLAWLALDNSTWKQKVVK